MTYVVTEACIKCKYMDCVEVCPVDCFYEGENMLVINPDECIDCGVCEPECPPNAILPDTEKGLEQWLELNRSLSDEWPNITRKGEAPADADDFKDEKDKFEKYFSKSPANARIEPFSVLLRIFCTAMQLSHGQTVAEMQHNPRLLPEFLI